MHEVPGPSQDEVQLHWHPFTTEAKGSQINILEGNRLVDDGCEQTNSSACRRI